MPIQRSNRRRFLKSSATAMGVGALSSGRADEVRPEGAPPRPYGEPASFEMSVARKEYVDASGRALASLTPLGQLYGIVTPSSLHFERHHAGVPRIDPGEHRLLIHGLVDRPTVFTVEDVKRFPSVSRIYFIECSGNGFNAWQRKGSTVQDTHGLMSCSEWTGVPLSLLLREAGLRQGANWIVAEGADAALMTRSIPLNKAMQDVLVAYGQNGEAIRPEQGYPFRLLVPGWEGNISVKWLRRIKVVDQPYMTREETSRYTDLLPDGKARIFSFEMDPKSVITFPSGGAKLRGPGFYEITGLAWSGRGAIRKVEVSIDSGKTWKLAQLQQPVLGLAHTRFRLPWRWEGNPAVLESRCTDEHGDVQPTLQQLERVRGTNWGYHFNPIQLWKIAADGTVQNGLA